MDNKLKIGGFTPLTSIDYPGELAAVVFCQGCPWRCRYCHNPELITAQGDQPFSWPAIRRLLEQRRGLLDAVVFSGGEPTLQKGLEATLREVRAMGFKIALHTAGPYPQRLQDLLPLLDWVGLDIKALPEDYPTITGAPGSGEPAWESARRLIASGLDHEIRLTVHPAWLSPEQVEETVFRLRALGAERVVLQPGQTGHSLDRGLASLPPALADNYPGITESDAWTRESTAA